MKNYVEKGRVLALAAPYDRTAGQGALVGGFFGVATVDVLNTITGSFQVEGVFDITKDTSTFSQGDKVYWDDSAKKLTSTSASNTLVGAAVQAQLTGDATCRVRLGRSVGAAADVAAVATTNAVDLATSEALANQLKTTVNAILSALKAAGLMQ